MVHSSVQALNLIRQFPALGGRRQDSISPVAQSKKSVKLSLTSSALHSQITHLSTMADNHKYPGIDVPLRETMGGSYSIGSHPNSESETSPMLQVREVAMMGLMDRLTDKPNWHEKIFNDEIVSKWRQEAMSQPEDGLYPGPAPADRTRLISDKVFNNCVAELRDKATFFKESGLIYTLDSGNESYIIKADAIMKPDLHHELKQAFNRLLADQATKPDWHPWTSDMVQDIVHPSMYPFVYNRSHFIHQEVVGVSDAIDKWSGKGQVPKQDLGEPPAVPRSEFYYHHTDTVPRDYWSEKYQWLPSTLAFQHDGTVKFTSYINNLHPTKYSDIYKIVEKMIDTAIPAWEHALSGSIDLRKEDPDSGQVTQRGTRFDLPPEYHEGTVEECWEPYSPEILAAAEREQDLEPTDDDIEEEVENEHWEAADEDADEGTKAQWRKDAIRALKWKKTRDPVLPEPMDFEPLTYKCGTSLRDEFKNEGLQVYVKMASIELTPEKPDFPAGGWHVEGQMNEQIVATALYYVDSENVTPSRLSFRMQTSNEQEDLQDRLGQSMHDYYEALFGVESLGNDQCLQQYGSVETQQGRLLAFPNTFQHQVSSFSLKDRTKPGHRRFIALWLVNPEHRVISTANVPPQQFDWWFEAVVGSKGEGEGVRGEIPPEIMQLVVDKRAGGTGGAPDLSAEMLAKLTEGATHRLPPEILAMVQQEGALDGLMTAEEANQHRIALMEERSGFHDKSESRWSTYSFCEH